MEIILLLFAAWILKRTLFSTRAHWTDEQPAQPTFFQPFAGTSRPDLSEDD